jgi:Raf kinase inhibitor-like YbhB/YbcL family protein
MSCRGYNGVKVFQRRVFGFALLLGAVLVTAAVALWFGKEATMKLVSPAFGYGEPLPARFAYCGEGAQNLSPPLTWSGAPAGTASFALVMSDPDAPSGTFVHWLVYDLPAAVDALPEGASGSPELTEGTNDYGALGYGGPCPPPGPAHRYFFRLYALDRPSLDLPPGATAAEVARAMEGAVLAEAEWMGIYRR